MARAKARKAPRPLTLATAEKHTVTPGAQAAVVVERRWTEYLTWRKQLEEAVEQVRSATGALDGARQQERACRAEFDKVKQALIKLLDVEPIRATPRDRTPQQRNLSAAAQQREVEPDLGANPSDAPLLFPQPSGLSTKTPGASESSGQVPDE
jgi:hypothetical protein